jgi:hypothetical protein
MILSQALENILRPRDALRAAARLLAPSGRIYIDTSNFYYYNAINPYHPYIFSPETLEELLASAGFHIIDREHKPHPRLSIDPAYPFLMVMAAPGAEAFERPPVDADALVADQALGLRKLADARAEPKRANAR